MGLLGSSVTLSAKRELARSRVVGYSHRDSTRQKARQYGVAHEIADTLEQAVAGADLVILATPIQTFEDYFKQMAPHLKDGCIVTDVGSTKTLPHQWAATHLPKGVYVGSHPIAGSEKRGVEFARDDLLVREKILKGMELTYTRLIKSKKERNLDLVVSKDGKIVRIPAKEYDADL